MSTRAGEPGAADLVADLRAIVGPRGCIDSPDGMEPFLREWRGLFRSDALAAVLPGSTAEASQVVALCARRGVVMVPQGGNTGLVGGAVASPAERRLQVILSARRLDRIRALDAENDTLVAEAGCVLGRLQQVAADAGRLFPLSLAAEGSCQLGGNISTNAGGINVLRFGNMREQVLGLEVVLPDGAVWDGLRSLRKDNTGYDLKQLFIGAEGTLGFITAAVCRLFPQPHAVVTALVAVASPAAALRVHAEVRARLGDELVAFEVMDRSSVDLAVRYAPGAREPLQAPHPWYLLVEVAGSRSPPEAEAAVTGVLGDLLESRVVADGVAAASGPQRDALWRLRHGIPEAQRRHGASIKHDVSVPISRIPEFVERASARATALLPGVRVVAFGHLGDGNLHFNLSQPPEADPRAFLDQWAAVNAEIHGIAVELGGSFSAEHGIGLLKTGELRRWRSPVEVDLMERIKRALDPANLMNPGKILGSPGPGTRAE